MIGCRKWNLKQKSSKHLPSLFLVRRHIPHRPERCLAVIWRNVFPADIDFPLGRRSPAVGTCIQSSSLFFLAFALLLHNYDGREPFIQFSRFFSLKLKWKNNRMKRPHRCDPETSLSRCGRFRALNVFLGAAQISDNERGLSPLEWNVIKFSSFAALSPREFNFATHSAHLSFSFSSFLCTHIASRRGWVCLSACQCQAWPERCITALMFTPVRWL